MGEVVPIRPIEPPPPPTGNQFLDRLEMEIISRLAHAVRHDEPYPPDVLGMAEARQLYLSVTDTPGNLPEPQHFLASIWYAVRRLPPERLARLWHPARNRRFVQRVLQGE